jgi:hypothetical protein
VSDAGIVDDDSAFNQFVGGLNDHVASLVTAAEKAIRSVDPTVTRVLWPHQRTVGYGVGPRKMSEHYAYLDVYDRHINLGFNYGATLPDPSGLLRGTGKKFRNVKITDPEQLGHQDVLDLLRAARDERRQSQQRRNG